MTGSCSRAPGLGSALRTHCGLHMDGGATKSTEKIKQIIETQGSLVLHGMGQRRGEGEGGGGRKGLYGR